MERFSVLISMALPILIFLFIVKRVKEAGFFAANGGKKNAGFDEGFSDEGADVSRAGAGSSFEKPTPGTGEYLSDAELIARYKAAVQKKPERKRSSLEDMFSGEGGASSLMEDRKNDWLARQLRAESKVRIGEELLDLSSHEKLSPAARLKREHEENCAADRLRLEHEANCAAEDLRRISRGRFYRAGRS